MTEDQFRGEVSHLHDCVEELKREMKANTEITREVRDILATFRVVGLMAKWMAAVGAAAVAVWHGWQTLTGR